MDRFPINTPMRVSMGIPIDLTDEIVIERTKTGMSYFPGRKKLTINQQQSIIFEGVRRSHPSARARDPVVLLLKKSVSEAKNALPHRRRRSGNSCARPLASVKIHQPTAG